MSLIQLIVGVIVTALAMAVFFPALCNAWRMQAVSVGMPAVQDDAKGVAREVADTLRGATLCTTTDSGCTVDAAVENVSTNGLTAYRRNDDGTLTKKTYTLVGGDFRLTQGGVTTTLSRGSTLTLSYYQASAYNSSTLDPYVPTNATLKNLIAVGIVASVTRNGIVAGYSTFVRLRNSPKPN